MKLPWGKRQKSYVVWDGQRVIKHEEDDTVQEYLCLYDGPVSLRDLRAEYTRRRCISTVFYACQMGCRTTGSAKGGMFTTHLGKLIKHDRNITFRDAVRLVNSTEAFRRVKQRCEVVCREDVLDLPVMNASVPDSINVVQIIDACRTPLPDGVPIRQQSGDKAPSHPPTGKEKKVVCRSDIYPPSNMGPGCVFIFFFAGHAGTR